MVVLRIFDTAAAALAVLAGFGLAGIPAELRIVLAFYALFIVPGKALRRRFFDAPAGAFETAGEVFVLGVVFASLAVCVGFIPGASYGAVWIAALGAAIALIWMPGSGGAGSSGTAGAGAEPAEGRGNPRARRLASRILMACLLAACFLALRGKGELAPATDAPDHVSFVRRSVESGALFPRDSYYREGDGASLDPRKGLWHPVLSLWVRGANAPADAVWRMAPACAAFFALCVLYAFAASIAGAGMAALLSVALFLVFGAGEGALWLAKLAFSRNMALVLLWADLHFIVRYCRHGRRSDLAAAALAAAAGSAFHAAFVLQALSALLGALCFVLLAADGKCWRAPFARAAAAALGAMILPVALRSAEIAVAHNLLHTHRQGMLVLSKTLAVVDPAEIAVRLGPGFFFALAAAPFYFLISRARERRSLVFFLFAAPVAIVFAPPAAVVMERAMGYLHYRILDAAPVAVMLAVVLIGLARTAARSNFTISSIPARIVALAALAIFAWYPLRIGLRTASAGVELALRRPSSIEDRYAAFFRTLEERVPRGSVIASDPRTSYLVSAFSDQYIAATLDQHGSPSDPRALERVRGIRDLLSPAVAASASAGWLDSMGVEFVLVNEDARIDDDFFRSVPPGGGAEAKRKIESCPAMFRRVFAIEGFDLYEVERPFGAGTDSACGEPLAPPLACGRGEAGGSTGERGDGERLVIDYAVDAGCGVVLSGAVIDRAMLRTIDTLAGYFCWRVDRAVPYGLPLEIVIRLDGSGAAGAGHDGWYGKQYRRYVERKRGVLYRSTWTERLRSGAAYPDLWRGDEPVRQDFALAIPRGMAPGTYELRVKVRRVPYLPVRTVADYLENKDSAQGTAIALVYLQ